MKPALKISILVNIGLMVWLIVALYRRSSERDEPAQAAMVSVQAPTPPQVTNATPFKWSQIESTDYRIYMANLRSIGCPEQTIRDIITADLDSAYAARREALRRKLAGAGDGQGRGLETRLEALKSEEAAVLSALLGPEPRLTTATPSSGRRLQRGPDQVLLPLAFQQVDAAALNLNDGQLKAIDSLQQWFISRIGGPDHDPNDPAYRQRWLENQPETDEMLRGFIGANAFQDYQIAARIAQQKAAETQR